MKIIPQPTNEGNTQLDKLNTDLDQARSQYYQAATDDEFIAAWDIVLCLYESYFEAHRKKKSPAADQASQGDLENHILGDFHE